MKRWLRGLLNLLTLVSLLAGVAAAALWVRTRSATDCWEYAWPDRYAYVWSHDGRAVFVLTRQRPFGETYGWSHVGYPPRMRLVYDAPAATRGDRWYRFAGVITGSSVTRRQTWAAVPYGMILALAGILPALRLWRRLSHRRPAAGHCAACGYDLRASPERCPECGLAVAGRRTAS